MPKSTESLNRSLFDLLRTKGYNPTMMDTSGKEIPVPEEADVFQFDFVKDGTQYGKVTMSIDGLQKLTIYFSDDVANSDKGNDDNSTGTDWYALLKQLKKFATHRQLSFELKNSSHLKHDMAKREYMSNKEKIREGYYPMGKKASYSDAIPSIKIVIEHSRQLEEGEARFRSINRIFLENQSGERYLLDTKKPGVARVYARHIAEGGKVNDQRWDHIGSLVEEYSKMSGFVRATKNGQFNESAQQLVNEGVQHYQTLRETLSRMTGHRGYNSYFESWSPSLMEDEADTSNINELFVQETLDPRIESVMPILSKLHKKVSEMKEVNDLSDWADSLLEGDGEELKEFAPVLAAVGGALARGAAVNAVTDAFSDDDEIDEGFGDHGLSQDTLDLIDEYIAKFDPTQDRDEMIQDILDGTIHTSELEYALQDEMDEGLGDVAKKVGGAIKSAGKKALDVIAPGDDELISQLRKSAGINTPHNKPSMARSEVEKRADEAVRAGFPTDDWMMTPKKSAFEPKFNSLSRPKNQAERDELAALVKSKKQRHRDYYKRASDTGSKIAAFGMDKEGYNDDYSRAGAQQDTGPNNPKKWKTVPTANDGKGITEAQQLSVQQLATISDEALDKAYGYGRSSPGNTFGWQANLKSAEYAKQMIDKGVTDIEAISDAIHKGWNVTAQAFVQNPEQFDDTAKLQAAGKLEAKLKQRAELMKKNYAQLPEDEKEKDRVVARVLLQALTGGEQDIAEGQINEAYIYTTADAVNVLANLRKISKNIEIGNPYKGNLANEYVNDVWDVYTWLENTDANMYDPKLKPILADVFELRKKAKALEAQPDSGQNTQLANQIVNTLYPLMQWIEMNVKSGRRGVAEDLDAIKKLAGRSSPTENFINTDAQAVVTEKETTTHKGGKVTQKDGVTRHKSGPGTYGGYDDSTHPDSPEEKHTGPRGVKTGHGTDKIQKFKFSEGQEDLAAMLRIINR
jgi:hypothetical protein